MQPVTVGVDVGGTKTHVRVRRGDEDVGEVLVPSREILVGDFAQRALALRSLVSRAVARAAAVGGGRPAFTVVGAHGCDSPAQCEALATRLAALLESPCRVVNDAELYAPAVGFESGVGVVAGTGSIAVGRDSGGRMVVAGGWGWLLGDEGSAAGLVREAVREVLRREDEGEVPDQLTGALVRAFAVPDVSYLSRAVAAARGAAEWGRHAPLVFDAADRGSLPARRVVEDGGRALAGLVDRLHRRGADVSRVVLGGGVAAGQSRLRRAFGEAVCGNAAGSQVSFLAEAPVVGALRLAAAAVRRAPGEGRRVPGDG